MGTLPPKASEIQIQMPRIMNFEFFSNRKRQVLYDRKWRKFSKMAKLFRHTPFVDFVFGAGSMALGNVHENSDFDVILGARQGKIFTARFFSVLFFGILGWRREKLAHHETAADKICFNHFVTEKSLLLSPPYNEYWAAMYKNLVPLFGREEVFNMFWKANEEWMGGEIKFFDDLRHAGGKISFFRKNIEKFLSGNFGDKFEKILKVIQVRKIKRSMSKNSVVSGFMSRIRYTDDELEFHPVGERELVV